MSSSAMPTRKRERGANALNIKNVPEVPEPNTRAVPDSLPFPDIDGDMEDVSFVRFR